MQIVVCEYYEGVRSLRQFGAAHIDPQIVGFPDMKEPNNPHLLNNPPRNVNMFLLRRLI